ncbi:hypothetical protein [Zhihengliuella halotolerans]|uniref:hypothetical protein n=1 Tax=Zhihengliuella halotolerans TaxID=370736 RepID=UPI000C80E028|nr:hypothetical protein [Zhihengliuella halotolerans]
MPGTRKAEIGRWILATKTLDDEAKLVALALLHYTNDDGVIIDQEINACLEAEFRAAERGKHA